MIKIAGYEELTPDQILYIVKLLASVIILRCTCNILININATPIIKALLRQIESIIKHLRNRKRPYDGR